MGATTARQSGLKIEMTTTADTVKTAACGHRAENANLLVTQSRRSDRLPNYGALEVPSESFKHPGHPPSPSPSGTQEDISVSYGLRSECDEWWARLE